VVRDAYRFSGLLHRKVWNVSLSTDSDSIAPKSAAKLFGQPLMVYVENRFTDGLFLDTILEFLAPDELRDFLDECEGKPFQYDSGGGVGELGKLIEDHVQEMAEDGLSPHAIVLTDSDAHFPGHSSIEAKSVAHVCDEHGIDCVILSKRAIENYIPDEVLYDWAADSPKPREAKGRVEVICRLTAEQRNHLAMKKPFRLQSLKGAEQGLFATVPEKDVRVLRKKNMFGNDLIASLKNNRQHLTAEALRQRDGHDELDRLISMIINAL
jgi:hypothetical protein